LVIRVLSSPSGAVTSVLVPPSALWTSSKKPPLSRSSTSPPRRPVEKVRACDVGGGNHKDPRGLCVSSNRFKVSGTIRLPPSGPRSSAHLPRKGRGRKRCGAPEWRDALAVFGHRFLAKSRNTFLSMIPSSMIVALESWMTGTRSPYFCSRTRSRSTSTSSRLADPNTWLARAIPSSHNGQLCLVYMRMDTLPAYRQINGAMGVARVT
jgi:hypothetical protein